MLIWGLIFIYNSSNWFLNERIYYHESTKKKIFSPNPTITQCNIRNNEKKLHIFNQTTNSHPISRIYQITCFVYKKLWCFELYVFSIFKYTLNNFLSSFAYIKYNNHPCYIQLPTTHTKLQYHHNTPI